MELERWEIDSVHSGIHFSVRRMVVGKVRGEFSRWTGSYVAEDGDLGRASVNVVIDASSIDTGEADRDKHLRSADFFDATNSPEITFRSTQVDDLGGGRMRVTGDLTIRAVTRSVVLDVEYAGQTKDPWGNMRAGFTARTSVQRKDFGLGWNQVLEAGGVLIGERVDVEIDIEAVKQTASKAA